MGVKANEKSVQSFFIQHTLPRFPVIPESLDHEKYSMFDSNASSSAQHFLCLSMQDRAKDSEASYYKLLHNYSMIARVAFLGYTYRWEESCWLSKGLKGLILNRQAAPTAPSLVQFTIQSTGSAHGDDQLKMTVICKSASYEADLYDDLTALLSIDHRNYDNPTTAYNSLMIVQSYVDPSMLGVNQKVIIENRQNVLNSILVQIANSNWVLLPEETLHFEDKLSSAYKLNLSDESDNEGECEDCSTCTPLSHSSTSATATPYYLSDLVTERLTGEFKATIQGCRPQHSLYKDHSKWSVNIRTGDKGPFYPLLCFYDLNRTSKQARRGGTAFCLNSSLTGVNAAGLKLWSFFLGLRPRPLDAAKFTNKAVQEVASDLFTPGKGSSGFGSVTSTCESPIPHTRTLTRRMSLSSIASDPNDFSSLQKFIPVLPLLSASKRHSLADEEADEVPILQEFIDFQGQDYLVSVHFRSRYYGSVPCPFKFADKNTFTAKSDLRDSLQVARFIIQQGWQEVLRIGSQCAKSLSTGGDLEGASVQETPKEIKSHRYAGFGRVQPCTVESVKYFKNERGGGEEEEQYDWNRYLLK